MYPQMSLHKKLVFWMLVAVGVVGGVIFLTPKFDGNKFLGGGLGFIISVLLSNFIFPEVRKMSEGTWNGKWGINMKAYFTHPTQAPMMLGMLWFCMTLFLMYLIYLFDLKAVTNIDGKFFVAGGLIPACLLIGLSGYRIIARKETITDFGRKDTGCMVYVNGVAAITFGWGGAILLALSLLFNW